MPDPSRKPRPVDDYDDFGFEYGQTEWAAELREYSEGDDEFSESERRVLTIHVPAPPPPPPAPAPVVVAAPLITERKFEDFSPPAPIIGKVTIKKGAVKRPAVVEPPPPPVAAKPAAKKAAAKKAAAKVPETKPAAVTKVPAKAAGSKKK